MAPVEGRNVRKYMIFSTVLCVLFALKIFLNVSKIILSGILNGTMVFDFLQCLDFNLVNYC